MGNAKIGKLTAARDQGCHFPAVTASLIAEINTP